MVDQNVRFWKYPSDRELILRSKINVGWSVNSHRQLCRRKPLSDSEMEFILHVISRAEEVELFEQQRIWCLVERLENIKKNTLENGPKSCSMCGALSGKLRSSVFKCYDCTKCVCNKCCVDTYSVAHDPCMLCKICAEDRELWKRSAGWFYGSLPIYAIPTRKPSPSPSSGKATWAHRKPEIVRLQSFEATAMAEDNGTRFLRSSWANLSSQTGNNGNEPESPDEFEMTTTRFSTTTSEFLKPVEDDTWRKVSLQHLAAPEENSNLLSLTSMSTSCPSLVPHLIIRTATPSDQSIGVLEFSLSYNSRSQVLQCTIYSVQGPAFKAKDDDMIHVEIHVIPFSKKMNALRTKSLVKNEKMDFNETLVLSKIRGEKLKKRILRLQILHEDPFNDYVIGEASVDLSNLKALKSKLFTLRLKENHSEVQNVSGYGWILLSLKYSPEDHTLILGVVCCSDLVSFSKTGSMNSFVRIKLFPGCSDVIYESSVKQKTISPTFNEEFSFHLSPLEMKSRSLDITVLEKIGKSKKHVGHVILGIQARGEMLQHWLEALQKPKITVEKWHALLKAT